MRATAPTKEQAEEAKKLRMVLTERHINAFFAIKDDSATANGEANEQPDADEVAQRKGRKSEPMRTELQGRASNIRSCRNREADRPKSSLSKTLGIATGESAYVFIANLTNISQPTNESAPTKSTVAPMSEPSSHQLLPFLELYFREDDVVSAEFFAL